MMPGRYAKYDESTGPIASIDEYAYRTPDAAVVVSPELVPEVLPEPSQALAEPVQTTSVESLVEAG